MSLPRRVVFWTVVGAGLTILLAGCDTRTPSPEEASSGNPSSLAPNVRLKIAYDETEATFSRVLPPNVVGQVDKSGIGSRKNLENKGVMENYESVHETKRYDEDGYLTRTYTHTDGHARLNLPEAAYGNLTDRGGHRLPENPITKFSLEGGALQLIRQDGEVAAQGSVDPERFRMDPERLDSLEALQQNVPSVETRTKRTRQRLNRMGVSLRRLGDHHVSFERTLEDTGLSSVRYVVDLRHGQPVHIVHKNEDGDRVRVTTRVYGRYNGVPVMWREVTYHYGSKAGSRTVVARTEVHRENISVQFN